MKKVYKKLTDEQIKKGVIFSSCLSVCRTEQDKATLHEVFKTDEDADEQIENLLNDSFFNTSSWVFNIIRK